MKIILGGETALEYFERMEYRGAIGIFFDSTLSGVFAYLLFGLIVFLSAIGLITVILWIVNKILDKARKSKW